MERKLQGDTGSARSLSSRDDGFGRKGVSFVDVDVVGTFIEPARPPPRIWRRRGGIHYATSKAFGIGETRDDGDGVHVIWVWICGWRACNFGMDMLTACM